jgi:CDP-diacylglycerol--serine O-phosphatidyltransferase
MACGLLAIRESILGHTEWAAWLVLYAVLLDQVDGTLARALKATSELGAQLDSFADFVSFGLAPAFLFLGARVADPTWSPLSPETAVAAAFVACCALRLARFNASAVRVDHFHGFPSTLAGALVATFVLVSARHGYAPGVGPMAALLGLLSALMLNPLGPIKMHALLRATMSRGRVWMSLTVANLALVYVLAIFQRFPEYLLVNALAYAIGGTLARGKTA